MAEITMVQFIMFVFTAVGASHVIVDGTGPVAVLRDGYKKICDWVYLGWMGKMVDCYLCCGCWTGLAMACGWFDLPWVPTIGLALGSGLASNTMAMLLSYVDAHSIVK